MKDVWRKYAADARAGLEKAGYRILAAAPAPTVSGDVTVKPLEWRDERPRGGTNADWWAESVKLYRRLRSVERAAEAVIAETRKIHDGDPWPIKYRAPYGAIAALSKVLAEEPTVDERKARALAGEKP